MTWSGVWGQLPPEGNRELGKKNFFLQVFNTAATLEIVPLKK